MTRAVWSEAKGETAERLIAALNERLEEETLYDDFAAGPVEAQIARIRSDLGLSAEAPANDAAPSGMASRGVGWKIGSG